MIVSKTYTGTAGLNYIESTELAFTTVYKVSREGRQHDRFFTGSTTGRTHIHDSPAGRIYFPTVFNPGGEKVFVIYKETSTVVVPIPGVCIPVVIPATTLPNGVVGVPYSYAITLEGSEPFELNNSIIVAWLDVVVTGNIVYLTGTTPVEGTWSVMFDVTNCNGATDNFFGTFDVIAAPITFIVNNQSPGTITNVSGSYTIMSGSFPILFNQSVTGVHPALTAAITVRISGLVFTYSLSLSKNGVPLEVIPVFAAGNYTFAAQTFLSADTLQIDLL